MPIFECLKGCTVSEYSGRCPRCGEWMKSHGSKSMDEVLEQVKLRQQSYAGDLANDKRRLDNSHIREVKKKYLDAEINYFRKQHANK